MSPLEEAIDIANRMVHFTLFRSMTQLRRQLRRTLKARGLEKHLRDFKLVSNGNGVNFYLRPGINDVEIKDYDSP